MFLRPLLGFSLCVASAEAFAHAPLPPLRKSAARSGATPLLLHPPLSPAARGRAARGPGLGEVHPAPGMDAAAPFLWRCSWNQGPAGRRAGQPLLEAVRCARATSRDLQLDAKGWFCPGLLFPRCLRRPRATAAPPLFVQATLLSHFSA
ncbi:hypothetical protein T484DRAFT_2683976 [Baffinella frigidus]|nr:hypothetical protein T484DRAFT_2683976 [Cryptophyta sp. CCMP2293]